MRYENAYRVTFPFPLTPYPCTLIHLSIIIVNWNTRDLLKQCLESVYETVHGLDFEVWVVDNASGDGSVAMVLECFPGVQLIQNSTNLGFARTNVVIPQAVSTTAILANLLQNLGYPITRPAADALLTGLITDTIGFRTASTTPRVLQAAAELRHFFPLPPNKALPKLMARWREDKDVNGFQPPAAAQGRAAQLHLGSGSGRVLPG